MIFQLIKSDGVAYEWKLLPYGIQNVWFGRRST
jgi:hypothetical protein